MTSWMTWRSCGQATNLVGLAVSHLSACLHTLHLLVDDMAPMIRFELRRNRALQVSPKTNSINPMNSHPMLHSEHLTLGAL